MERENGAGAEDSLEAAVRQLRLWTLGALTLARKRFGDTLAQQQEVLAAIADMAGELYAVSSLRPRCWQAGDGFSGLHAARAYTHRALNFAHTQFKDVAANCAPPEDRGDLLREWEAVPTQPISNVIELEAQTAEYVIDRGGYPW
jgi:hypothetical protein